MARTWINVTAGSTTLITPTNYTEEDFHGKKANITNNVGDTHAIDSDLPRIAQLIQNYVDRELGVGNTLVVTSTKRTSKYNIEISHSGSNGVHVRGIAMDFAFIGSSPKEAWKLLACSILNEDDFFASLLAAGAGGFGLYGRGAKWFFHIDTRDGSDGLPRGKTFNGQPYALWTRGSIPSCDEELTQADAQETVADSPEGRHSTGIADKGKQVIEYTHPKNAAANNLSDLVEDRLFIGYEVDLTTLKDYEFEGITNNQRLWRALTIEEKRAQNNDDESYSSSVNYTLSEGVVIMIPVEEIDIRDRYESNLTSTKTNANEYFPPVLRTLTTDPGFIPAYKNRGLTAKDIRPQLRVFVWSRAKYLEADSEPGFIDITKDIINCQITNHVQTGGDFSISISGVGYRISESDDGGKIIEKQVVMGGENEVLSSNTNRQVLFQEQSEIASEFKRNIPYYQRMIGKNDLVFISYEKLNIDGPIDEEVSGKWYDMIGLVDHAMISSTGANNQIDVMIRGRSLIAALEEDNAYFNPFSIGHVSSAYGDTPFANGRYLGGQFQEISAITARSIQESLEFIFHRIASIGYVPDDVFASFEDVTAISKTVKNTEEGTVEEEKEVKGVWQIMNLFVDSSIANLRLVDDSISNPDGMILDLILKVCQDPFVEFITDTYGDRFWMIVRKPPFERQSVLAAYRELPSDVDDDFEPFSNELSGTFGGAEGDQANRYREKLREEEERRARAADSTKKPTVIGGDDAVNELDEVVVTTSKYPRIININEDDVISDSLRMSSRGYAWYQVEQRGNFAGANQTLGHVPALYFDAIAQVIGNRRLSTVSNYSNYKYFESKNTEADRDLFAEQASQELAYLVESNIHLPFTREGSITINGDRRIKVGNYIYYRPTDEIFYVTQVSNEIQISNSSIDRRTIVEVERGMKKEFIRDKRVDIINQDGNQEQIEVSYFNIVDIPKLQEGIYDIVGQGSADDKFDYKSNMAVNEEVLRFFLQNKQFDV